MNRCCPHPDEEHDELLTCQEVIHYPSEDYPCLCEGFRGTDVCDECGHRREVHHATRVCRVCGHH